MKGHNTEALSYSTRIENQLPRILSGTAYEPLGGSESAHLFREQEGRIGLSQASLSDNSTENDRWFVLRVDHGDRSKSFYYRPQDHTLEVEGGAFGSSKQKPPDINDDRQAWLSYYLENTAATVEELQAQYDPGNSSDKDWEDFVRNLERFRKVRRLRPGWLARLSGKVNV